MSEGGSAGARCAVILGLGAARASLGLAALGLAGMPRRYLQHALHGAEGWLDLGFGAAIFGGGVALAVGGGLLLAALRASTP